MSASFVDPFPPGSTKDVAALAGRTGAARDLEVFEAWLAPRVRRMPASHRPAARWLLARTVAHRDAAYRTLRRIVPRGVATIEPLLRAGLEYRSLSGDADGSGRTFRALSAEVARKRFDDLLDALRKISGPDDDDPSHRARIAAKKLRYVLEPAVTDRSSGLIKGLKALQDAFGTFHDLAQARVQIQRADARVGDDGGPAPARRLAGLDWLLASGRAREGGTFPEDPRRLARRNSAPAGGGAPVGPAAFRRREKGRAEESRRPVAAPRFPPADILFAACRGTTSGSPGLTPRTMPTSHRRFAAALIAAALVAAAVVLVAGGGRPVAALLADIAGSRRAGLRRGSGRRPLPSPRRSPRDGAAWDLEDADDPDAAAWVDPAVRPLRVRLTDAQNAAVGGVPVVVLGRGENGPVLAGPKMTNSDGRVRFPIDLAMEQVHDVVVAARAVPGRAATTSVKVGLDRDSDVTLTLDAGIRATIIVLDPEGRPIDAGARPQGRSSTTTRSRPGPERPS